MTLKLDLIPVFEQAKELNMSSERLLRKLRNLERARGLRFVYGGGKKGKPYEMDRRALEFLHREAQVHDQLKDHESRIKRLEQAISHKMGTA